jgi:hypothetical protein
MRYEPPSPFDAVIGPAELLQHAETGPRPGSGLAHSAAGFLRDLPGWPTLHPLLAVAAGSVLLAVSHAVESALSSASRSPGGIAHWASELLLSGTVAAATYLWLRGRSLRHALAASERTRIEREKEMRLATAIQRHLLKAPRSHRPSLAWHARLRPGRLAVGDFYEVLPLPNGATLLLAADVSAKGILASIAMASALSAFRRLAPRTRDLSMLARALSAAIHYDHAGAASLKAIFCRFDPAKGVLQYLNGGYPAGRLAGPAGLLRLGPTGPPLGLSPDSRWESATLRAGDYTLGLLLSQGMREALETDGDPDELVDALTLELTGDSPEAVCNAVMRRARRASRASQALPNDRMVLAFAPRVPVATPSRLH